MKVQSSPLSTQPKYLLQGGIHRRTESAILEGTKKLIGEIIDGTGELYITMPKSQTIREQEALDLRTKLLVESDFSDLPVTQARLSDAEKTAWATYRQALRDITLQQAYPWDIIWPVKP